MSTEQSDAFKEVANSPGETSNSVAITQQATTPTPTTAPRVKNPKRVAAGKLVAERTRLAREQQKKAAAEAAVIIANNKAKKAARARFKHIQHSCCTHHQNMKHQRVQKLIIGGIPPNPLGVTQWIGVISIGVSLLGIYYKREELKAAFSKKKGTPERYQQC